jgi:hypothetical protein
VANPPSSVPSRSRIVHIIFAWHRTPGSGGRVTSYRDRYWIVPALFVLPLRLEWFMGLLGSDKKLEGQHAYGRIYYELFCNLRYRSTSLLEMVFCRAPL